MTVAPIRHVLMTADAVGGVWTYALDLARGLAAVGVRTTLVVLGPAPDAAQGAAATAIPGLTLRAEALPLDWLAETSDAVTAAGEAVAAIAAAIEADIVHLNSPSLAASARFDAPVVGVCHSCVATWWDAVRGGALPADFRWRKALLARGYAAAETLIAPTAAFAVATAACYSLPWPPRTVYNGRTPPAPAPARQADFVFTAGRLWDEGKSLTTLDRAAAGLAVPLFAAGPTHGPNGAAISLAHAKPLGSLPSAALAGWLARGPVFASVARYEPFGLVVLEAAQAGCALVLSDIPSFRELWDGAAVFVSPADADGTATACSRLLAEPTRRAALAAAARERAGRYSIAAMTRGTLDAYRDAAMHAAGAQPREQAA